MIHINPQDMALLRNIINKFPYTFYAYGSRVKGTHQKFSDLDLCIAEAISDLDMFYLKEALEESDLPFKVDIQRLPGMSADFKKIIEKDLIKL
jgi:predicted nucleotidyltransferase